MVRACYGIEQRRLARAVRPDNGMTLPFLYLQVDAEQNFQPTEIMV
jgi:hypothetical protein